VGVQPLARPRTPDQVVLYEWPPITIVIVSVLVAASVEPIIATLERFEAGSLRTLTGVVL
jgi:hypothetical protein